ncbi:MAG: type II toxin-antitoxin system PemK/MazF family toxin [Promethearchaeota archaeon]|nr:MAG: type II toxin-antitoxin system PemK/MazF family toxin [Candidatus Lokiarchaeota archaeon]
MVRFIKGEVVVVPFPFSDLSQSKRRPAIVITDLTGDDIILCQITSQSIFDKYAISLSDDDFQKGSLKKKSNIRPNRIFTADSHIILYKVGRIKDDKIKEVINKIIQIIQS